MPNVVMPSTEFAIRLMTPSESDGNSVSAACAPTCLTTEDPPNTFAFPWASSSVAERMTCTWGL